MFTLNIWKYKNVINCPEGGCGSFHYTNVIQYGYREKYTCVTCLITTPKTAINYMHMYMSKLTTRQLVILHFL